MRATFKKYGGALGAPGSVSWAWRRVGEISVAGDDVDHDAVLEAALDAGADVAGGVVDIRLEFIGARG